MTPANESGAHRIYRLLKEQAELCPEADWPFLVQRLCPRANPVLVGQVLTGMRLVSAHGSERSTSGAFARHALADAATNLWIVSQVRDVDVAS